MLFQAEKTRVRFENNQCLIEGRSYSTDHVILVEPKKLYIKLDEDGIKLDAEYEGTPRSGLYGSYVIIGVSSDKYIPSWDYLEGKVRVEGDKVIGEGELGIRGSLSNGYVVLEILGEDLKPVRAYVKELEVEAERPDFVNALGSRFQSFYLKTPKNSMLEAKITKDKAKIKVRTA